MIQVRWEGELEARTHEHNYVFPMDLLHLKNQPGELGHLSMAAFTVEVFAKETLVWFIGQPDH